MTKKQLACILVIALLLSGCAGQKPDASLEGPSSTAGSEPSGTNTAESSNPTGEIRPTDGQAVEATDPITATEKPSKPTEAPKPTETQPKPTEALKPTEAHQHSYKAQTVAANCISQGYTIEVCACGAKTEAHDYTPALGHDYQVSSEREATPWASGYTESTCSRCGELSRTETGTLSGDQLEAFRYEVAKAALKYINEYRVQEGSTELTYLPGLSQVAMYRSEQLITNFKHDTKDIKAAFNHYQYGRYVDATEYGDDASLSYYTDDGNEAIGKVHLQSKADAIGKKIANNIHESAGHWRYISDSMYSFAGVGWCVEGYWAFFVSPKNYG